MASKLSLLQFTCNSKNRYFSWQDKTIILAAWCLISYARWSNTTLLFIKYIYTKYQLWHLTNCIFIGFFFWVLISLRCFSSRSTLLCRHVYLPCDKAMSHDERMCCRVPRAPHRGSHCDHAHWLPYSTIFVCLISSSVRFWFLVVQDLVSLERSPCSGSNSLMFQGLVFPVLLYRIYLYVSICFQRLLLLLRLITFVPSLLPLLLLSLSQFFNWSFKIP